MKQTPLSIVAIAGFCGLAGLAGCGSSSGDGASIGPGNERDAMNNTVGDGPDGGSIGMPSTSGKLLMTATRRAFDQTVSAGSVATVNVLDAGMNPATVQAAILNITVAFPTEPLFARVWPSGETEPSTGNILAMPPGARANFAITRVGADGTVSLRVSSGSARVIVDVEGYFSNEGTLGFKSETVRRLVDTRKTGGAIPGKGTRELDVGGLPAAAISLTVISETADGYAAIYPSGTAFDGSYSHVNFQQNQFPSNQVIVATNGGKVTVSNQAEQPIHIVADLMAGFTADSTLHFVPLPQAKRAYDTRAASKVGNLAGPVPANAGQTLSFAEVGVPANAQGLAYNFGVSESAAQIFVALYPADPWPETSILNVSAQQTVDVGGVVGLNSGNLQLVGGNVPYQMVMDVAGYFSE